MTFREDEICRCGHDGARHDPSDLDRCKHPECDCPEHRPAKSSDEVTLSSEPNCGHDGCVGTMGLMTTHAPGCPSYESPLPTTEGGRVNWALALDDLRRERDEARALLRMVYECASLYLCSQCIAKVKAALDV